MAEPSPPMVSVDAQLLGQHYRVACRPEEQALLREAVALLQKRLAEAGQQATRGVSKERLTLMVAMNLAADLLRAEEARAEQSATLEAVAQRLQALVDMGRGEE
ncbi:MAG: cell division protein ZapA [Acidithiobacillus sp.]|uniref:cell division protein ZapA n=1 Tax=Acidithiobacillus sp. TaxID=1872118 RepID=UPI0025C4CC18|nr:cell division protein ZapA [Acidithiobacillus sp.]